MTYQIDDYKIKSLVDELYDDLNVNVLDFTLHLQANVALNKKITKGTDGRPIIAEYFYESSLMAVIKFNFVLTEVNGMLLNRTANLHYILNDETEGAPVLIKEKTFNLLEVSDIEEAIRERELARKSILATTKVTLSGLIVQFYPLYTSEEIIDLVKPFYADTVQRRLDFIELGDNSYAEQVAAYNTAIEYEWLANEIAPSYTIQDYIVATVTLL